MVIVVLLFAILLTIAYPDFMRAVFAVIGALIGVAFWGAIILVVVMLIKVSHGA